MRPSAILASASALALLLWSIAPLCGDPGDLDPESCCDRSASCSQTAATSDPLDASDCCAVDQPGHPAANLDSSVPIFPSFLIGESLEHPDLPGSSAVQNGFVRVCLQAHSPPLYLLFHNYRI